jgi:hypothetical protein
MSVNLFPNRRALAALLAAPALCLDAGAAPAYTPHTVAASVCDAASPNSTSPSRRWGVSNPGSAKLLVSCPVPQDYRRATGYKVTGWTLPGASIYCQLRHIRKEDGSLLHQFSFTLTGITPAYMGVPAYAQGQGSVAELLCELPAKGKGWLTSIDTY